MTIIAWDGQVLAADSAGYNGGRMIPVCKLTRAKGDDYGWFACCGEVSKMRTALVDADYDINKINIPLEWKSDVGIIYASEGEKLRFIESGKVPEKIQTSYFADGQNIAVGMVSALMDQGFSAHIAIKMAIGMRLSDAIMGPVQYVDFANKTYLPQVLATSTDLPLK